MPSGAQLSARTPKWDSRICSLAAIAAVYVNKQTNRQIIILKCSPITQREGRGASGAPPLAQGERGMANASALISRPIKQPGHDYHINDAAR